MSRQDLLEKKIRNQMADKAFYRINALNYTGCCFDGTPYSEVIAQWLCEEYDHEKDWKTLLLNHSNMQSEKAFPVESIHKKEDIDFNSRSNRNEENIAKRLFQMDDLEVINYPFLKLVDYQVPINRVQYSSEGKVDLIFSDGKHIVIGELKDEDSSETLLRAVVEAKTYQYKIESCKTALKRYTDCYLGQSQSIYPVIQPAVFLFENDRSQPWLDFVSCMAKEHSWLKRLMAKWDMQIFAVRLIKDGLSYAEKDYCIEHIG